MYRCQICGGVVPAHSPAIRQVVETRRREYPFRSKANPFRKDGKVEKTDDPGGVGREIVREILVCQACSEEPSGRYSDGCDPPALLVAA